MYRMADVFMDAGVVLTWFLAQLGASNWLIGLISPIRLGGWFFPQIFVSGYLQRQPCKLPLYRAMSILRGVVLVCVVLVVVFLPSYSVWLLVTFFTLMVVYSIGEGLAGIPFMDMVGRVVSPTRRGAFFGQRMFWGSLVALAAGPLVGLLLDEPDGLRFPVNFAVIFGLGFLSISVSMTSWCLVRELPEEVDPVRVRWTEQLKRGMLLLQADAPYRTYVLARLSLMVAQMAAPFYIVYAKNVLGIPARMVGVYLTARTATSILSNLLWGRISDHRGNRQLIRVTNVIGLSVPLAALFIGGLGELVPGVQPIVVYLYALVFVASGALGAGSSIGNINYLLEIAPAAQRSLYLGFTNTLFGLGVLASSLGGLIVDWAGFRAVMLISAAFYALALGLSFAMVEPRQSLAQMSRSTDPPVSYASEMGES